MEVAIILVILVITVAALSSLAGRIGIPYPILLVVGGLVLGLIPWLPEITLAPDIVFLLFLPGLLFYAAVLTSLRDLRSNLRPITILAFGLVAATIVIVAVVARMLVPGMPWAVAFALGAIVSPTDPIAATSIMQRLGVSRRVRTIVEGESLLNDTGAVIFVRVATAAAVGQGVSVWGAAVSLPLTAIGGVAIGLAVGWVIAWIRQRLNDTPVEILLSLVTGYAAYLLAEEVGASGILATVSAGLLTGWRSPLLFSSSDTRLDTLSFWRALVFLGNAMLFILIGLQLPIVLDELGTNDLLTYVGIALAITVTVIGARLAWNFTIPYLIRFVDRRPGQRKHRVGWRDRVVIGWSGMRGGVSLAAALSLPLETDSGEPFPERGLLIFIAFVVVLVTLVVQGLTLPTLIRRLGLRDDGADEREEVQARLSTAEAALQRLDQLDREDWTRSDTIERLRGLYEFRRGRFAARNGDVPDDGADDRSQAYQRVVRSVIEAQRDTLVELRRRGVIGDDVLRKVQRDLDLEDSRLEI